jgi:plastocyanin
VGFRRAIAAAIASLLLVPAAAAGADRGSVDITAGGFDPAVVVVPPGARVKWTNRTATARRLAGDFDSPPIGPGTVFKRRFPRPGIYEYHDRGNPALTGTVIVGASGASGRGYPPPTGPRLVAHHWRATLSIAIRERWDYLDGKYMTLRGPCNAEIGQGSRIVQMRAAFPDVLYRRFGRIETLVGRSRPYGIQKYDERIQATTSEPGGGRVVDCPDGSREATPDVRQVCNHDYSGTRVRAELLWSPTSTDGRFLWPHGYLSRPPREGNCGHMYLAGTLVGLDVDALPWDPGAGSELYYDEGRTGPATLAETRALRDGRPLTIRRHFDLGFTLDCCVEWHERGKPGTYGRVGARHSATGTVTIRFRPTGP